MTGVPQSAFADGATDERRMMSWPLIAAFVALAVLCGLYLAWPVWRAFFPFQIDYVEAWSAYHADTIAQRTALYPAAASLVTNNYPPLSYYVVATIASWTVDVVYVGRALSLMATVAAALAVMALLRQVGGSRAAALLAGLWVLAPNARLFA